MLALELLESYTKPVAEPKRVELSSSELDPEFDRHLSTKAHHPIELISTSAPVLQDSLRDVKKLQSSVLTPFKAHLYMQLSRDFTHELLAGNWREPTFSHVGKFTRREKAISSCYPFVKWSCMCPVLLLFRSRRQKGL